MAPKRKQTAKGAACGGSEAEAESSGSEDLVSQDDDSSADEDEDEEDEDEDDDAPQEAAPDDGEGSDFEELQVDFEFFDLKPVDFHGLRALFQRYLDGELPFALSELVEVLIAQANSVGAVVKADSDVDPLGVMSVLALDTHRQLPAVHQILGFMRRKCTSAELTATFDAACAAPRMGLILSERMLNMPPELAPPLISGLFQEIEDIGGDWWWKSEKAPTEALRKSYEFDHFLALTRVYRDDAPEDDTGAGAGPASGGRGSEKGAKRAKHDTQPVQPRLIYPKPEDEALHKHATWSYLFPATVPEATLVADRANQLTQMRLVMCVAASKAKLVVRDTERALARHGP